VKRDDEAPASMRTDAVPAIVVEHAVKEYGALIAVNDVSFTVAKGETLGLLGPNGAGKSTLIRLMTTLVPITSGRVLVGGHDVARDPDRARLSIGVIPQAMTTDTDLSVEENLDIYAKLYGVGKEERKRAITELLELVHLSDRRKSLVGTLSGGMRRRVELARGLVHHPDILFLDEPTIGLDVVAKARVREFLAQLNRERQVTLLLTTHDLDDIEKLCRRVMIIDRGRLLYDGPLETLKARFGEHRQLVVDADAEPADVRAAVDGRAELVSSEHGRHVLRFARDAVSAVELIAAVSARLPIKDLTIQEPEIDDIVARIYREGI